MAVTVRGDLEGRFETSRGRFLCHNGSLRSVKLSDFARNRLPKKGGTAEGCVEETIPDYSYLSRWPNRFVNHAFIRKGERSESCSVCCRTMLALKALYACVQNSWFWYASVQCLLYCNLHRCNG